MSRSTLLKLLLTKATILASLYIGASYHQTINRAADNLIYNSLPVQEGFFTDYNGLELQLKLNKDGKKEPHLSYEEEFSIPLTYKNLEKVVESEK